LRAHYELELRLARRLMTAPRAERHGIYGAVYAELFAAVPDHPQRARRQTDERGHVDGQLRELRRHLGNAKAFLEIGAGDCRLAFAVCARVGRVVAVDVCDQLVDFAHAPENFCFALSDGTSIPVLSGSIDVAYSNQLMEHLHPEDALEQLANIYRALKPGGVYHCITPSRISGPHDISVYFDSAARGLHLKEYSYRDLTELFGRAGFRRVAYRVPRLGGAVPRPLLFALEALLEGIGGPWRPALCQNALASRLLGIHALAYK
jgi:SAM-dependent methyltransferase